MSLTTTFLLSLALAPGIAAGQGLPSGLAVRTHDPVRLDGSLEEPAWSTAPPIGAFTQREPEEDAAPSEVAGPGSAGLWTKADSVTAFADIAVEIRR